MRQPQLHPPWDFDIDRYANRLVPPPPWRRLPMPVKWFLGYRDDGPPRAIGNLAPIFWAFVGIFCAIALIIAVDERVPAFEARGVPLIVGSFGAAAVLEFYSIESPLAQPRNAVLGQLVAAFTGVCVQKLFLLGGAPMLAHHRWAAGALACAAATALMALTKTVHPPAGATALLAVVDDAIVPLGWFLLPVMMLGCALMLAVALLVNNVERRFPLYWWTPEPLSKRAVDDKQDPEALDRREDEEAHEEGRPGEIVIRRGEVILPKDMQLLAYDMNYLEGLSERL